MPLGAGLALGAKYLSNKGMARGEAKSDAVAFALCGDGAANQGQVTDLICLSFELSEIEACRWR